jgi:hypothetical protein
MHQSASIKAASAETRTYTHALQSALLHQKIHESARNNQGCISRDTRLSATIKAEPAETFTRANQTRLHQQSIMHPRAAFNTKPAETCTRAQQERL